MKIIFSLLLVLFLFGGVFWLGSAVQAQSTLVPKCNCPPITKKRPECTGSCSSDAGKGCDESDCIKMCCGTYEVNDIMNYVIKAMNIMFGLVGSLVLLFFIYGGFLFLTAAGSNERVTKGKRVIIGSVVGLLIVFFAYTIIGYVFVILDVNTAGSSFSSSKWFQQTKKQ